MSVLNTKSCAARSNASNKSAMPPKNLAPYLHYGRPDPALRMVQKIAGTVDAMHLLDSHRLQISQDLAVQ